MTTFEVKTEVSITVQCKECGATLEAEAYETRRGTALDVSPCQPCLERAKEEARGEAGE